MKTKDEQRPFGLRDKFGYALGDAGNNFTLNLVQGYLLVFYTKVIGVSAGIIGTVLLLAKFVDAFTDIGMGRIVDTHTSRKGERFLPWIRRGAIPLAVLNILIFNIFITGWPMYAKFSYMCLTYLLYGSFSYTMVAVPYGAMVSVLTTDPKQRSGLSAFRNVAMALTGLVLGIVIPQVVYSTDAAGNEVAVGPKFLIMAVICSAGAALCYFLCTRWSVERVKIPNKPKSEGGASLFTSVKQVLSNRAILSMTCLGILTYANMYFVQSIVQFLFMDYFKNTALISVAMIAMLGSMVLVAPFATKMCARFGKKEVGVFGVGASVLSYIIVFIVRPKTPPLYLVALFIAFLGVSTFGIQSYAMIGDCIEDYFIKNKERADGTVYAIYSFVQQLGMALTSSLSAWALAAIGYDSLAVVQTEKVANSIFNLAILVPLICLILVFLILLFVYPLTKEKVLENAAKVRAMAAEAEEAQEK